MKPISLVARAILNSSHKGDLVLDPFGGSGSTLIAAEQTERTCHMLELDPKYCDVIVKRYIENTGSDDGVFLLRSDKKIPFSKVQ
jgi:DNA modification methylase